MNLKLGIVGLPNVGKSTLFNAVTKSAQAEAANYPFCTIDPNVGLVNVPDERLGQLAEIVSPERILHSVVEFVDIAGLVRGASEGEGLGNQFLSHIRECQALCHVVRAFEDENVHHVDAVINPSDDLQTIMTELILADLQSVTKQLERATKKAKSGDKEAKALVSLLERAKAALDAEKMANTIEVEETEIPLWKSAQLLTAKPFLIIANVAEDDYAIFDPEAFRMTLGEVAGDAPIVPICAVVEAELATLDDAEAAEFLAELGVKNSGLVSLIRAGFSMLGLQNYFTAGVTEVRSWTIPVGATAPQAAGAIHTDFERGFIKADVIGFDDYIAAGSEAKAKETGKLRMEGKQYIVQDGDVIHFKFNV